VAAAVAVVVVAVAAAAAFVVVAAADSSAPRQSPLQRRNINNTKVAGQEALSRRYNAKLFHPLALHL
jgi:hypothetical protein